MVLTGIRNTADTTLIRFEVRAGSAVAASGCLNAVVWSGSGFTQTQEGLPQGAPEDRVSALPWARQEVFSFVLHYKQRTRSRVREEVGHWTREVISLALRYGGRYYLPYQLHATIEQFEQAYPEADRFRRIKAEVDPAGKLSNELWRKYL